MVDVTEAPAGLEGVVVSRTTVSDVHADEGFFHLRGYDAVELNPLGVEAIWHLLHEDALPDAAGLASFTSRVRGARVVPDEVAGVLAAIARTGAPGSLQALASAVLACGQAGGWGSWLEQPREDTRAQALVIPALMPVLAAHLWRLANGLDPVEPDPTLGHAANLLWMVHGEQPAPARAAALERYMALTLDHGFNNSTFTARVIASSGADLALVTAGAIGALSGPLHGGAPARVREMLQEIATADRAEAWVRDRLARKERIMGFGHRIYRQLDPRSEVLHTACRAFDRQRTEFAEQVETTVLRVLSEHKPGRKLPTNVEFYAGVVLELTGLPPELFVTAFACSRSIGWMANVGEQIEDNKLMRPVARYVGPRPPRTIDPVAWDAGLPLDG